MRTVPVSLVLIALSGVAVAAASTAPQSWKFSAGPSPRVRVSGDLSLTR